MAWLWRARSMAGRKGHAWLFPYLSMHVILYLDVLFVEFTGS